MFTIVETDSQPVFRETPVLYEVLTGAPRILNLGTRWR